MGDFNLQLFLISMLVLIVSLTVHEMAHAKAAESAGDDTARLAGRISINPLDHLDPIGTVMMIMSSLSGFGIGWAKPVPVNPAKFRHPRWDNLKVSLWGPLSNLILAFIFAQAFRFFNASLSGIDRSIIGYFVIINIMLALFNLIPISPLDGSHIMSSLLPVEKARRYDMFMMRYGFMILLGLVIIAPAMHIDILSMILVKPAIIIFRLFTGLGF
ncbi:MAG: site-2 protease family protein [Armatimonadota bacterium]